MYLTDPVTKSGEDVGKQWCIILWFQSRTFDAQANEMLGQSLCEMHSS